MGWAIYTKRGRLVELFVRRNLAVIHVETMDMLRPLDAPHVRARVKVTRARK